MSLLKQFFLPYGEKTFSMFICQLFPEITQRLITSKTLYYINKVTNMYRTELWGGPRGNNSIIQRLIHTRIR